MSRRGAWEQALHAGVEALVGLFLPLVGEVEGEHRGCELGVPQGALQQSGVHAGFEQRGGGGMSQGMERAPCCGQAGPVLGFTAGALDPGAAHRGSCRRTVGVSAPSGGQEPGRRTMGFPGGAQQREGSGGPGDVAILGALAAVAMAVEALTVHSGDLEEEGGMEPEAQARDRGAGDVVVERGGGRQESPHVLHTEDSGEVGGGVRAQERQRGPVAWEDVLREEAHTAVADAQGGWGEAVDVCAVQEGVLQLLCRDAVGGCVGELRQQPDCPDRGGLRPCALAAEGQSRDHLSPSWAHGISPFGRRVVGGRRKTSETNRGRKRGFMTAA
jgi:hypothetical protein